MNSILQDEKICFVTGSTDNLQKHHVFYGTSNRKNSEKHGCWVYLHIDYHTGTKGVHSHHDFDLQLKMAAQKAFEQTHTREEFMKIFGRNYL